MLLTEFSTEFLSAKDRFACWMELGNRAFTPVQVRSTSEHDFRASHRVLAWEGVQISASAHPSLQAYRTPKLIRQSDPEAYQVNLVLNGEAVIRQAGREALFGVGEFALCNTSLPLQGWRSCTPDTSSITVQISRALLPLPASRVDRLTAIPFSARHGMGATFSRWLVDLTTRAGEFTPADAPTLTSVTVDLLSAVLAAHSDAEGMLAPESRRRGLRLRINEFIEQRLGDPALTPKTIADAHHMSLRSLQQLFAAEGTTPATWIRQRRLEHCRRDLANPHLRSRPIRAIAARWGFTETHFSRLFRAAYGTPPRDYRNAFPREYASVLRE